MERYNFKNIPLKNWKVCQEGNIFAVRKGVDVYTYLEPNEEDLALWESMQDAYIAEFNEDKDTIVRHYSTLARLANLKLDYLRNGNKLLKVDIMQLQEEIDKSRANEGDKMTLSDCQVMVSKFQGYHIKDKIKAYEFFNMIKIINKHGKDN